MAIDFSSKFNCNSISLPSFAGGVLTPKLYLTQVCDVPQPKRLNRRHLVQRHYNPSKNNGNILINVLHGIIYTKLFLRHWAARNELCVCVHAASAACAGL
jgi:hypothetical protein